MALVLETLGRNQALDLGSLGVRLLALALGLDLTANDKLADLNGEFPLAGNSLTLYTAGAGRR